MEWNQLGGSTMIQETYLDDNGNEITPELLDDSGETIKPSAQPIGKLAPIKSENKLGVNHFDNLIKTVSDYYNSSPILQRFVTGEAEGDRPEGITDMKGPGLMPIPGLKSGIDKLADKIDNPLGERGALRGFAAGALQGVGSLFEGGFDPRTAGIRPGGNIPTPEIRENPRLNPIPETRGSVRPDDYPIPGDIKQSTGVVDLKPEDYKLHPIEEKKAQGEQILKDALAKKSGKLVPPEDVSFTKSGDAYELETEMGIDKKSVLKEMRSLYEKDNPSTVAREFMQNSLDAIEELGDSGQIDVNISHPDKTIEFTDNGKGMTPDEVQKYFYTLGGSGKRFNPKAIGGKGMAKAAPLIGAKQTELITTAVGEDGKIYKTEVLTTPDDIIDGKFNRKVTVMPKGSPLGTTVKSTMNDNVEIPYQLNRTIGNFLGKSIANKGTINVINKGHIWETPETTIHKPSNVLANSKVYSHDTPTAGVDLIVPNDVPRKDQSSLKLHILNNGMWQFEKTYYPGWDQIIPNSPDEILVNIKSKIQEGDLVNEYPFISSREKLSPRMANELDKIIEQQVVRAAQAHRTVELTTAYQSMPSMPVKGGGSMHIYDAGGRLTPAEMMGITAQPNVRELANVLHTAIYDTLDKLKPTFPNWYDNVEKVGFLFHNSPTNILYGANAPNPQTGKHAVLINWPEAIKISNTPDEAASLISHLVFHEIAHEGERSEGAAFTFMLARVYGKIGRQHENDITGRIFKTLADSRDPSKYNSGIQDVLQKYIESRGRPETTPDILSGTASKSTDGRPKRKGKVPSNSGPLKSRIAAVERLVEAIKAAKPIREEQEASYSAERAGRFKAARKYSGKGLAGFYKQLSKMKGEYEKVDFEHIELDQEDVDNLINMVDGTPGLMDGQKLRAKMGIMKLLGEAGGQVPQRSELKLLDQVFGDGFSDIVEMHGGLGGPVKLTNELVNLPKSIAASLDFSAPLRQGLALIHKKAFYTSLGPMFKAWASEDAYRDLIQTIHNRPLYNLGEDAGLSITDRLSEPEEQFVSGLAERIEASIPGYNKVALITRSDRAYTAFLDKLRADTFDDLIREGIKMGHAPQKIAPSLAQYINTATGRAPLPGRLERVASEMNIVFFSPRLIASRLQMLNPKYYQSLPPFVRKEALKSLFAVAAAGAITLGLAEIGGQTGIWRDPEEESSPINSDFGKAKFGKTRLDPWGGFQQYIVAAMKLIRGESTSTVSGKTTKFGSSYTAPTRLTTIGRFTQSKLSPAAAFVVNLLSGKDFEGNPINKTNETLKLFIPLITSDLYDIAKEDPKLLPLGINATFGQGVQTYKNNPKSGLLRGVGVLRP